MNIGSNYQNRVQTAGYQQKAKTHMDNCLKAAERVAARDNSSASDHLTKDALPEIGEVMYSSFGTTYSLAYKPQAHEAAKPPFWKFWQKPEPQFQHGDVIDFRDSTEWEGTTIESLDDGSTRYEKKQLGVSYGGGAFYYDVKELIVDGSGSPKSYLNQHKDLGDFRGGPIPEFQESDHREEFQFS